MSKKTRSFTLSMLLTLMLLALTASAVAAAPPLDLHIEVTELIGPGADPFIASGSAVVAGKVCATGEVEDINVVASGSSSGTYQTLHVLKRFTCDDLSGTFDVKMVVKLNVLTGDTTANWKITGGTGSLSGLKGHGSLVGTAIVQGSSILDVYDGKVK